MSLTGVHLLLTYRCEHECDHCFVWGSPWATGTMPLGLIREILEGARRMGTVQIVYFEGGEPFLFYGKKPESGPASLGLALAPGVNGHISAARDIGPTRPAFSWESPPRTVIGRC